MAYGQGSEGQPLTIDDFGFSGVMNDRLFSSSYRIESNSVVNPTSGGRIGLQSMLEIDSSDSKLAIESSADSLGYLGQGLGFEDEQQVEVRRFSTALETQSGVLTVGNDWSNFQDFLLSDQTSRGIVGSAYTSLDRSRLSRANLTTEQISWETRNGFSIAVENELELEGETLISQPGYSSSPSLVLSWKGRDGRTNGEYSFSAMGRNLELNDSVQVEDNDTLGWGLNLAGGWRFGDLFAALKVTLGNSIDSFILGQLGDRNTAASALQPTSAEGSFNLNPSLSYRLGETSNLHFSLNRFKSSSLNTSHGIDTLDTIHLGYTWNPWPSTRIGIEFVGKDVEGVGQMNDSNEVNFAASKRF